MSCPAPPSGEDFSTLFTFLPIGAYRSSPDGRQLRANLALVRLNGYASEAEQLEGVKDIAREWYVDPDRRDRFVRLLERDGFVRGFESEIYRHKTRERIWIRENAHVVRDAQGAIAYYEGTVEDISDHRRMQATLQRSDEQMQLISSQIPGMVFVLHVSLAGQVHYRFVSEGIRDLYGLEPGQLLADPTLLSRYRHTRRPGSAAARSAAGGEAGGESCGRVPHCVARRHNQMGAPTVLHHPP